MPRPTTYTTAERATLAAHYTTATRDELLAAFSSRTWNALQLQARAMGMTRPVGNWTAAALAILAADYPLQGAKYVAALVGHDEEMVRRKAKKLHIFRLPATPEQQAQRAEKNRAHRRLRYGKGLAERPKQTVKVAPVKVPVKVAPVKAAPVARPSATAVPLLAVKQSTHTPNLNMAREARKRKEAARSAAPITSEEIRKLPANHPARHAYAMNGVAGWQQWKAAQV